MPNLSIEIDDLTTIGVVQDQPSYQLPPEALTQATNIRAYANGLESIGGHAAALGTNPRASGAAPVFVQYVSAPAQPWWLWASLTDIFAFDGTSDTNITRAAGGTYGATDAKDWYGCSLGGVPILGTRADIPQYWSAYSAAQKMQNLPNWPAGLTARVIRPFGPYLLAWNTTLTGTNTPHRVRWSSSADPGSVPSTWDITDILHDAGQTDLQDVWSGGILDGQELGGQFFIYKENAVWRVQFIGGQFIFNFQSFLENIGLLATRCVALTGDGQRHVFATQDDIAVHNGSSVQSILTNRMRKYLFNTMDVSTYDTSFMFANPLFEEMWFCYPLSGSAAPNHAIIWNYRNNTLTEADSSQVDFCATSIGTVSNPTTITWAQQTLQWNQDPNPWVYSLRRKTVVAQKTSKKLLTLDTGADNDGTLFTSTIERDGLSIMGQKRNGEWIQDWTIKKLVQRLWPKLSQGTCSVQIGYQETPNGAITWSPVVSFDPTTKSTVDNVLGAGRAVAVRFYGTGFFHLDGYKIDVATLGKF